MNRTMTTKEAAVLVITAVIAAFGLACNSSLQIPPSPTPLSLTDLRVVELSKDVRPTDFFGDEGVGIGSDGELYLVNITTGEMRQITDDGNPKWGAVISADYVAWIDQRRKIELPGTDSATPQFSNDIFLLDLSTGKERRITDGPAERQALQISGSRLVWQDNRNEIGENYTHFDIYAYHIEDEEELPVAIAPGAQHWPAIDGDTVVWADNRNSPVMGTPKAGCSNCPDNRFDIYSYNFSTGEESPLVESGHNNGPPSIHGQQVAWQGFREDGGSEINVLDIGAGHQRTVAQAGRTYASPLVSDDFVVWTVRQACDVVMSPPSGVQNGSFALDLMTNEVRQLSNYVEPHALLYEDVALIHESCFATSRVYAVFLRTPHP